MRFFLLLAVIVSANAVSAQGKIPPPPPPRWAPMDTSGNTPDTAVFQKVEIEASVDRQQWIDHITRNLQPYVEKAAKKGMKPGLYTVQVRFLVEKDGSISDVQALNDPGYGLAKGAEKVVRTGPRWNAGELNGRKVRSYHTQPISFIIQEQ